MFECRAWCTTGAETNVAFLRFTTVRKDGKTHQYWRLVRSVRRNGKLTQEVVAQLGDLDARGRARAQALSRQIMGEPEQRELFEADTAGTGAAVPVRLDAVQVERKRQFGDVWLGWRVWRAVGLDGVCREAMPEGREEIPWHEMAAILVLARLCEPSSELHIAESWYRTTALEDLLGVPWDLINDDRLYRALDHLLPHKAKLEQHIQKRLGELLGLEYDLLLYDVTSTYFEGLAEGNPQAQRGYSRDHRPDCKQVCIALVVSREGMPLGYEVFAGNRADVTTVQEIVEKMEKRFGIAQRVWVMDRGMVSAENVEWLQKTGRRYLIGTAKASLKRWERYLVETEDWKVVRPGLEVKLCGGPSGSEVFILCRSEDRKQKERAMHERFASRIEAGLAHLDARIAKACKKMDRDAVQRFLGRLLSRNSRSAGRYDIHVESDPSAKAGLRLRWTVHPEWDEWARVSEGCYLLRSNLTDWESEELWKTYIQLTDVEAAFRVQKDPLSIRPIWHQKEHRAQAHILVCFLAYVLWKTIEKWQERAGLGNSPRKILDELRHIESLDVVLPLVGEPGREARLRCVVRPEKAQAMLIDRFGLRLPTRLRIPAGLRTPRLEEAGV